MEALIVVVSITAVIGLIGLIIVLVKRHQKQRTADLAELAAEMSLRFSKTGDAAVESSLSHLSLMQRGHGRKLVNLISGQTQSVDLNLFDYRYTTGHGKHQHHHAFTVVAFDSPLLRLPAFELSRENIFHKLASSFGYQDIDFAEHPTFSRKYLLRGPDEDAIRYIFDGVLLEHFEQELAVKPRIGEVLGNGTRLVITTSRQKPADLRAFLARAFEIYGLFKSPNEASSGSSSADDDRA